MNVIDTDWEQRLRAHFAFSVRRPHPSFNELVSGTVVANAPFGVIVDIGCGTPALIDEFYIEPNAAEQMEPHWTKVIGSTVWAKVRNNSGRFIELGQWDYDQ